MVGFSLPGGQPELRMVDYPVNLRLDGRCCVVVGGGPVATRRVESLLAAGGRVTVISPNTTPVLAALAATHEIVHHARAYRSGDLDGAFLAVVATDDRAIQRSVAEEAQTTGALLNVVDEPARCTFTLPAVVRRGELTVAISTGGASPALARRLRQDLEDRIGGEYALFVEILARLRERLAPSAERRRVVSRLVESPTLEWLREGRLDAVDGLLATLVGHGCSLADLGVSPHTEASERGGTDGS